MGIKSNLPPPTAKQLTAQTASDFRYKRQQLYPLQFEALFDSHRYSCIEATTKSGKTAGCLIWLGEKALSGTAGRNYWWVAPTRAVAKIAFDRMVAALTPGVFTKNISELRLDLVNGTHIWFKGAEEPDSLYGEDVFAAVLDECSRMKEGSWHAVRTTLTATRGHVRLIGNVKGRKNWFFKLCRKAQAGAPNFGYHKITWREAVAAKILDAAEIDDARNVLPPAVFKELYEADPCDDEGNPFGIPAIRSCLIPRFSLEPISCWGWDLGKRQDWTVGVALTRKGDMAKLVRFQAPWAETKRRIIAETGSKRALVDATGVGDPIVEDLVRVGPFSPFVFTSRSKQDLMELLQSDIQQKRLGLTEGVLVNELETFEYEYRGRGGRFTGVYYSAPEGMYDDCVCALGLADHHLGARSAEFRFSRVPNLGHAEDPTPTDAGSIDSGRGFASGGSWEDRPGLI
jgi:hypothetical protein